VRRFTSTEHPRDNRTTELPEDTHGFINIEIAVTVVWKGLGQQQCYLINGYLRHVSVSFVLVKRPADKHLKANIICVCNARCRVVQTFIM
jgi:hypothetical protein